MKYVQKNPLPVPASGPADTVNSSFDSIFDWQYALEDENLDAPALWKLWAAVSLVDLGHSAKEAVAAFPAIPSEVERQSGASPGF